MWPMVFKAALMIKLNPLKKSQNKKPWIWVFESTTMELSTIKK